MSTKAFLKGVETWKKETKTKKVVGSETLLRFNVIFVFFYVNLVHYSVSQLSVLFRTLLNVRNQRVSWSLTFLVSSLVLEIIFSLG